MKAAILSKLYTWLGSYISPATLLPEEHVYGRDQQTFSGKSRIINILYRFKVNSLLSREAPLLSIFPVSVRALSPSAAANPSVQTASKYPGGRLRNSSSLASSLRLHHHRLSPRLLPSTAPPRCTPASYISSPLLSWAFFPIHSPEEENHLFKTQIQPLPYLKSSGDFSVHLP